MGFMTHATKLMFTMRAAATGTEEALYRIAIIPGDGTGPEVVREALKVLDAASSTFGFPIEALVADLSTVELLGGLAVQVAWIVAFAIVVRLCWGVAVRRFSSVGG